MKFGYVRVSSEYQNEARQITQLEKYDLDKIFVDKKSGKDFDRPAYQNLKQNILRSGGQLLRLNATRLKSDLVHTLTSLYWMRGSNANAAS